jgi:Domain of unknown function (DUF4349)
MREPRGEVWRPTATERAIGTLVSQMDRSDSMARRSRSIVGLGLVLLVLVVVGCSSAGGSVLSAVGGPVTGPGGAGPVPEASAAPAQFGGDASGASGGGNPALNDPVPANLLVIKTGTMSLQVKAIDDALAAASRAVGSAGGYVAGSQRQGSDDGATATVTYRIPAARWDDVLITMRGLGDKVLGENSQSQDVTGDVIDLGARIRNLQATEQALQGIIEKATKITDVLAVQSELTKTRGEIEQLTTQKQHLEGQAAFSTLTVTFGLKPLPAVVASQKGFDPASEVDRASASLVAVLQALATAGIWFGIVWLPILVVLGIVGGIAIAVVRRFRREDAIGPGPVGPGPVAPSET